MLFYLYAGIEGDMKKFFDKFGANVKVNGPSRYKDQSGGYYSLGGGVIRNSTRVIQPGHVQMPQINAGCGGINVFNGSFSYLNSQELIGALKNIGSSAASYGFMLALETVSPQIASTMKQLQTWAQKINEMNINSCEAASSLVGSVWPKGNLASSHACKMLGSHEGWISDFAKSRHACNDPSARQGHMNRIEDTYPVMILDEFNIAWKVLQEHGFVRANKQLAECFMSITGTLVKQGERVMFYHSKVFEDDFLRSFMEGGRIAAYSCSDQQKCLIVDNKGFVLPKTVAFKEKIVAMLTSIERKIFADEELSVEEKNLVEDTRFPIYKVINIMSAYRQETCPIDLIEFADIIAQDMLMQYIKEVITQSRYMAEKLKDAQADSTQLDRYMKQLDHVEKKVRDIERQTKEKTDHLFTIMQKIDLLEKNIYAKARIDVGG